MSRAVVTLLTCLGLLCAGGVCAATSPGELIEIHGNVVLVDEVYLAVLELPDGAGATPKTAALVRRQIARFLKRAGYELANVEVRIEGDRIWVDVNEGRLNRIVVLDGGSVRTVRLKLGLKIPHRIFNRPYIDRQLGELARTQKLGSVSYELVRAKAVEHDGIQMADLLNEMGELAGYRVIPPLGNYDLHIRFSRSDWSTGFGLDFEYGPPYGLMASGTYKGLGLVARDDRWKVGLLAGMDLRDDLDTGDTYAALSQAEATFQWFTPGLFRTQFRPYLWLVSDLQTTQRKDLLMEIYYRERLEGSLNLGYTFGRSARLSLGGGMMARTFFRVRMADAAEAEAPAHDDSLYRFAIGRLDWTFNPGELRRDRRHYFTLEGRRYWGGDSSYDRCSLEYLNVIGLGWHDLILGLRGVQLLGDFSFDEDEPVGGRYVRGVFHNVWFVDQVASMTLEFRLSLARDLLKLSVFNDLAVFGEQIRVEGSEPWGMADAFGFGLHALLLDEFQFGLYYAVGTNRDLRFDSGLSTHLKKVF